MPESETGVGLESMEESDISDPIITKMIIPSKPGRPRVLQVTGEKIELEWTKLEQGAHNLKFYSVSCCGLNLVDAYHNKKFIVPEELFEEHQTAISTTESCVLRNLDHNLMYIFKVCAHYKNGVSEYSERSEQIIYRGHRDSH